MEEPKNTNRYDVPFDDQYFKKLADQGLSYSIKETFRQIYQTNFWNNEGSVSGNGANRIQTKEIARRLPDLIDRLNVKTMLDLPCGDFNWMSAIDLGIDQYTGGDILEEIIVKNQQSFADKKHRFVNLDITGDELPMVDLLFCRDCLVHLSFEDIRKAFENIKRSGIKMILTTTFTGFSPNHDIVSGDWRPLDLQSAPFNLPQPIRLINEKCTEGSGSFSGKSMGLWPVQSLPGIILPT
ncbi:MAG: class I SAM-dependent methyltransferase [bacterium]|nr:class I SAM-dependent methyltransferase [bacterium]